MCDDDVYRGVLGGDSSADNFHRGAVECGVFGVSAATSQPTRRAPAISATSEGRDDDGDGDLPGDSFQFTDDGFGRIGAMPKACDKGPFALVEHVTMYDDEAAQ